MCEKHELRQGVTTILLSAGGVGVGPVEKIVGSLLGLKSPAQLVALCGRNDELKRRVEETAARSRAPHVTVKAVGYTNEVDELMSASDILLGKPGGLTTSEGLAKGLGFCVVNPIPGQEERNSDHLLEEGVGIRCNNLPALAYKLDRLIADPARLASMREHSRRLARPHAARDIVSQLLALSG